VLPGESIKVVSASSRSITVAEDFIDRPLVIGYLGFDYAILDDGVLGPPIPTHAVVEKQAVPSVKPFFTASHTQISVLRKTIEALPDVNDRYQAAAVAMGPEFKQMYDEARQEQDAKPSFNSALLEYLSTEPDGQGPRHYIALAALQYAKGMGTSGQ
jgi:hypothetical protein